MSNKIKVGIFGDSFYPVIDGVSQVVHNYCKYLNEYDDVDVVLVTPRYPGAHYGDYEFKIYSYTSIGTNKSVSYRVGWPFHGTTIKDVKDMDLDIIHIHAPFCSSVLAHYVNKNKPNKAKVVLTYHTKYDVDFESRLKTKFVKDIAYRFLKTNINQADEVWIVSPGSESSLRNVGFRGQCRVMENGVDFVKQTVPDEKCRTLRKKYNIPEDVLLFLFVGRMQWYKNLKLTIDALAKFKETGIDFRMLFVGTGTEFDEIKDYSDSLGMQDKIIFAGSVSDREELRIYYTAADVFLFLSTFDTAAIVVKEAAACNTPCLFALGSDSAFGVTEGVNGWFTEESPEKMAQKLKEICEDKEKIKEVGLHASETLYVPWKDSVHNAYNRYLEILNHK